MKLEKRLQLAKIRTEKEDKKKVDKKLERQKAKLEREKDISFIIRNHPNKVDGTIPYEVNLTEDDIKNGIPLSRTHCALVVSITKDNKDLLGVQINRTIAWLVYSDKCVRYAVSSRAKFEAGAGDRSGKMYPGKYWLNPLSKSQGKNAKKSSKKKRKRIVINNYRPRNPVTGVR